MKDYAKLSRGAEDLHRRPHAPLKQNLTRTALQKNEAQKGSGALKTLMVFGCCIAVLIVLGSAYHQHLLRHQGSQIKTASSSKSQSTAATHPIFDFYSVLPGGGTPTSSGNNSATSSAPSPSTTATAVTSPASSAPSVSPTQAASVAPATPASSSPAAAPAAPTGSSQYYLETGTYSNPGDAQQMLSELLLLGVNASIVTVGSGNTMTYQVLVGPYSDQDEMNVVKQQLAGHQIAATVISK